MKDRNKTLGVLYGIMSFTLWGSLPLYWKLLQQIPSMEILAHRITWSFVFVAVLLLAKGGFKSVREVLTDRKKTLLLIGAAVLITINWFTYIWAVNSNFVLQASLGYYINPLVVSLLSMIVLKEKFNQGKRIALILATIGVLILTVQYGSVPWVSLVLATTFAVYGLVKKVIGVDSLTGMTLETSIMTPVAIIYIVYLQMTGSGNLFTIPVHLLPVLIFTGVVTAVPLLWFAKGAQLVEFSTMGFLQYIAPTISFFLGVFLFREEFTTTHLISFIFIWAAVIVYIVSMLNLKGPKPKKTLPATR